MVLCVTFMCSCLLPIRAAVFCVGVHCWILIPLQRFMTFHLAALSLLYGNAMWSNAPAVAALNSPWHAEGSTQTCCGTSDGSFPQLYLTGLWSFCSITAQYFIVPPHGGRGHSCFSLFWSSGQLQTTCLHLVNGQRCSFLNSGHLICVTELQQYSGRCCWCVF